MIGGSCILYIFLLIRKTYNHEEIIKLRIHSYLLLAQFLLSLLRVSIFIIKDVIWSHMLTRQHVTRHALLFDENASWIQVSNHLFSSLESRRLTMCAIGITFRPSVVRPSVKFCFKSILLLRKFPDLKLHRNYPSVILYQNC